LRFFFTLFDQGKIKNGNWRFGKLSDQEPETSDTNYPAANLLYFIGGGVRITAICSLGMMFLANTHFSLCNALDIDQVAG
jgi:hypothetical protein